MKKKLTSLEIKVSDLIPSSSIRAGLFGVAVASAFTLSGCSDEKNCSDLDSGDAIGAGRYDIGVYADPYDAGTDVDATADPIGLGDRCADFD